MPNDFQLAHKSDSLFSLLTNALWPSSRTQETPAHAQEPGEWHSCNPLETARTDYPDNEPRSLRALRDEGYGMVGEFFHAIQQANTKLMHAQWQQFEKELFEIDNGDRLPMEGHQSPNDIKYYGESYGSLPDQLMSLMNIINADDSPFHCELPRIAKANDQIPEAIKDRLKKHPEIERNINKLCDQAKIERMLDITLTKSGAKNPITVGKIDQQLSQLDKLLPMAREYDEVNQFRGDLCDCNDRVVHHLENLQANLLVIKAELQKLDLLNSQVNLDILASGGKA